MKKAPIGFWVAAFVFPVTALADSQICIFGSSAGDLMNGKVPGIEVESELSLDLAEIKQKQIWNALQRFDPTGEDLTPRTLERAIQRTDDARVNLTNLHHTLTGKRYVFVEFGFGNSNSFGAVYPIDSEQPVAEDVDGDVQCL